MICHLPLGFSNAGIKEIPCTLLVKDPCTASHSIGEQNSLSYSWKSHLPKNE